MDSPESGMTAAHWSCAPTPMAWGESDANAPQMVDRWRAQSGTAMSSAGTARHSRKRSFAPRGASRLHRWLHGRGWGGGLGVCNSRLRDRGHCWRQRAGRFGHIGRACVGRSRQSLIGGQRPRHSQQHGNGRAEQSHPYPPGFALWHKLAEWGGRGNAIDWPFGLSRDRLVRIGLR